MNFKTKSFKTKPIEILIGIFILFSLSRFVSEYFYLFDLFNHLKPISFIGFLILTVILLTQKKLLKASVYLTLGIIVNWGALPLSPVMENNNSTPTLKIAQYNLNVMNYDFKRVVRSVNQNSPDVISFQEVTHYWQKHLRANLRDYQFICQAINSPFGICVASKLEIKESKVVYFNHPRIPSIEFKTNIQGAEITFLSTHPKPPFNQQFFNSRNHHFEQIIENYQRQENLILIGDLNITQWSPIYSNLEHKINNKNTHSPFDMTWHTGLPIKLFQLDHILIDKGFKIKNSKVLDDIGSDHLPIYAEIQVR